MSISLRRCPEFPEYIDVMFSDMVLTRLKIEDAGVLLCDLTDLLQEMETSYDHHQH